MSDAPSRIYASAIQGNDVNPGVPTDFATFMVGQSGNETGGWTSKFFTQNNNCFGYSCSSGSKWQNGCSAGSADNGVSVGNYDSIEDSTQEVVDWWYRRTRDGHGGCPSSLDQITTADQYGSILSAAEYYTSDSEDYIANIKAWIVKAGSFFSDALNGNPTSLVLLVVLVAAGIYVGVKKHWFAKIGKYVR